MPALKRIGAAALSAFGFGQGGVTAVTANFLVVAGGGAGGNSRGGGGGAGGYQSGTTSLVLTTSYTVTVGAGGAVSGTGGADGGNGSNSSFGTLTASVGGGGGEGATNGTANITAKSGGSGAGAATGSTNPSGGSGTSGQGYAGGAGLYPYFNAGGGGGSGGIGATATITNGGNGGIATASSITGTSVYYAGGGGGGIYSGGAGTTVGLGGGTATTANKGGATDGASNDATPALNATANTGGGAGGGGLLSTGGNGGQGGSGVVIISYAGSQQFGGGVVTSAAGNTIHTFYTSGVLSPLSSLSASYLIVAGGGGGGASQGAGAGGGGMQTGSALTIDTNSTYVVTVGAGGTGAINAGGGSTPQGSNGSASSFSIYATSSVGGGGGGTGDTPGSRDGKSGGSGGGSSSTGSTVGTPGSGTSGQGNSGGSGSTDNATYRNGGGGGGAGQTGGTATASITGYGGNGSTSSISGTSTYYAGGGAGGWQSGASIAAAGLGGGGTGGAATAGGNGTTNLGGGGGGGGYSGSGQNGGNGGSGIVIIAYAGSTQQMSGGTVTVSGGNVIHTFTSSGYLSPLTNFSNSLRWRSSATAYLNRTQTAGNQQKWTWSGWVKRGTFGTRQGWFSAGPATSRTDSNVLQFGWQDNNTLQVGLETTYVLLSTQVFRDPAAWYHFVVNLDTTQATASNRMRIYVNGSEITAWATDNRATAITQNASLGVNLNANPLFLGAISSTISPMDGYMTNVNFIDGQQLTPNSFGSSNQYGNWVPVTYGGSYGTNGFFLPFNAGAQTYSGGFTYASSQVLSVADNAALELGSSDFCVEGWYYPTSFANNLVLFGKRTNTTSTGSFIIYAGSGGGALTFYASSNGSSYFFSGTGFGTVVINQWNHFAVYRSGNNWYGSVNGVVTSMGSNSSSIYNNTDSWRIGGDSNGNYANGYISNTRIVTGSSVYGSSNFIPSASPLTAITGTQLLTLQNSTIIDNSTNGFTITNTGSVTTATDFPLSTGIFNDQSPQGNNWTPSGISGIPGSTLDYMVDVPTLSNATSSNYCVVSPLSSGGTITDGNLKIVIANSNSSVGTMAVSAGKWYCECTIVSAGTGMWFSAVQATNSLSPTTSGSWNAATGLSYRQDGSKNNGSGSAYGATYTTGDTLSMALDLDGGTITFYKNGTSQGVAFSSGVSGYAYYPVMYNDTASTITWNFGQQPFTYTPPSGYLRWNTYNI